MERIPKSGELYRHFKDKLYQIVTIAVHSETGEKLVVYQALYGEYKVYARPLSMFVSEVDHIKYPWAAQKYRFERVEPAADGQAQGAAAEQKAWMEQEKVTGQQGFKAPEAMQTKRMGEEEEKADPGLLAFLDAENMEEKYNILVSMRERMSDQLINNLAVSLDVVIPEGKMDDRYEALKNCLRTRRRYESERLR